MVSANLGFMASFLRSAYTTLCVMKMYSRVGNMKLAVWDAERSPAGKVQGCNLHKIYCILSETGGHMKCIIVVLQYKNGR